MNRALIVLIVVGVIGYDLTLAQGQNKKREKECTTIQLDSQMIVSQPWFANKTYLSDWKIRKDAAWEKKTAAIQELLVGTPAIAGICTSDFRYLVPVKIIVWQGGGSNADIDENFAVEVLREANRRYAVADSRIQFYLRRSPHFRTNAEFANGIQTDLEAADMFAQEFNGNHISIHLVGQGGNSFGQATPPTVPIINRSLWVKTDDNQISSNAQVRIEQVGGVLAHELGHTLGLQHTHEASRLSDVVVDDNGAIWNNCYQEPVSRIKENYWYHFCLGTNNVTKCSINGDQLCDTEADPNMNEMSIVDNPTIAGGCDVSIDSSESSDYHVDNWGETWRPNPRNIMGYSNRRCRNFFSDGQISVMEYYLDGSFSHLPLDIAGPALVACDVTSTFSIPAVFGATYTWAVSGGATIVGGQGTNSVSILGQKASSSLRIISVSVASPHVSFCKWGVFVTGAPVVSAINGPQTITSGHDVYYSMSATQGASYDWTLSGTDWSITYEYGKDVRIRAGTSIFANLSAYAYNSCGISSKLLTIEGDGGSTFPCDDGSIELMQNPVDKQISVQIIYPCTLVESGTTCRATLYDSQQSQVMQLDFTDELVMDVGHLPAGEYILHVQKEGSLQMFRIWIE